MSESGEKEAILKNLNTAQKEAVTWPHSPLLILAGAGSGKTRILTHRIAQLIHQGVPNFNILGVTFTNKAAQEMKNRVQRLTAREVWISTFHSTCLKILRMNGDAAGLDRQFSIYDEYDQLTLIKECIKELSMNEKQVHPKGVRERIQRAKDFLTTPDQYAEKADDFFEESVAKIYKHYEKRMGQLKACDFGDLIMKTVFLYEQAPLVLKQWQDRFQHILVDEYQDTNHAQYRLIKMLAEPRQQITVVGDPDQSIYAWRGADIKNILSFEKDYPQCGIIKMERNYRSSANILDAANQLIKHNAARKPKDLWTEREAGDPIEIYEAADEKNEAMYIAGQVNRLRQEGRTLADQVIFYRVHAQSRSLEDALRRLNIPYKIVGGTKFYDRKEIKDVIAYLKLLVYPHDEISLKRIINVPARGMGKKAIEMIENAARQKEISFCAACSDAAVTASLSGKAKTALPAFNHFLEKLRKNAEDLNNAEILHQILEKTGYLDELEQERTVESQARIENIEEFFTVIADFEETSRSENTKPTLRGFLESISLMTDLDAWQEGSNVLTLMTFHTAKGLEFPVVYMAGLEEGIFPNVKAYTDDSEEIEEERRLCYVGMTRAKDKLTMTYARERLLYGSRQFNLPSRFLNEIPHSLLMMQEGEDFRRSSMIDDDDIVIEYDHEI